MSIGKVLNVTCAWIVEMRQNNERDETHTTAKENLRLVRSNADDLVERRGKKNVKQNTLLSL